jgi:hypothetical protein
MLPGELTDGILSRHFLSQAGVIAECQVWMTLLCLPFILQLVAEGGVEAAEWEAKAHRLREQRSDCFFSARDVQMRWSSIVSRLRCGRVMPRLVQDHC